MSPYIQSVETEFDQISETRKTHLLKLSNYFQTKYKEGKTPKAIVICTHNSRRSHLGQIWLAIGAEYYGLPMLETYSGGTEATAFNPRAVAALQRIGLDISTKNSAVENPLYHIRWNNEMQPYQAFSKKYDAEPNPQSDFAAIMICTSADKNCPVVLGMDFRFSLPFDDPKAFDGTDLESAKYDERCRDIAREILFCLSRVDI